MTRAVVEKETGITEDVLEQYENRPGLDAYFLPIMKLAAYYQTTAEDLLKDPDPNIPPQTQTRLRRA